MTAPGREDRDALLARIAKKRFDTPAWQRKEGQNPNGGLNAKGRASYARETGGKLRPPVKSGDNPRRASFLARMGNMPGPERDENGEPTRLLLSLQAWGASSKADARAKAKRISARLQAKKSVENVEKGEGPGHPFRGNQYTRGTGAIAATAGRELKTGGGFTVDPRKPTKILRMGQAEGFVVATHPQANRQIPATQLRTQGQRREAIDQYIKDNEATLSSNKYLHVGGWLDKESGTVHLDLVSVMPSRAQAVAVGKQHGELAIFDLKSGDEIFIKEYRYGRTEAGGDGPPRRSDHRPGHRRVLSSDRTGPRRGRVNKGEGPGHPFRGNQHVKVGGGLSIGNSSLGSLPDKSQLGDAKDLRRFAKGNSKDVPIEHLVRISSTFSADGIANSGIAYDQNGANGPGVYFAVGDHGINYWKSRYRYRGNPEVAVFDVSVKNIKNVYIRQNLGDRPMDTPWGWQSKYDAMWDITSGAFIVKDPKNVMVSRTYRTVSSADRQGLKPITKGEGPGHPFRGNQYVRGRSGGNMSFSSGATLTGPAASQQLHDYLNNPSNQQKFLAGVKRVERINRGEEADDPRTTAAAERISKVLPRAEVRIAGMHPDYAEALANSAEKYVSRYPDLARTVHSIDLDVHQQMGRRESGLSRMDVKDDGSAQIGLKFNIAFGADPQMMRMVDKTGYLTGWHPAKHDSFTFDHEFGHAVDYTATIRMGLIRRMVNLHHRGDMSGVSRLRQDIFQHNHLNLSSEQRRSLALFDSEASRSHFRISTGVAHDGTTPRMRAADIPKGAGWGYGADHYSMQGRDPSEYIADAFALRASGGSIPRPLASLIDAIDRAAGVQKALKQNNNETTDSEKPLFTIDLCAGYTAIDFDQHPEIARAWEAMYEGGESTEKAFRSKAQWRWAFATGQPWARRWAHETPGNPGGRYRRLPKYRKLSRAKANMARPKVKKTAEPSISIPTMQAEVVFDMTLKGEGPGHPFRGNQYVRGQSGGGLESVPGYVGTFKTANGTNVIVVKTADDIELAAKAWSTGNGPELEDVPLYKIMISRNDDTLTYGLKAAASANALGSGTFLAVGIGGMVYWQGELAYGRHDMSSGDAVNTYRVAVRNMKNVNVLDTRGLSHDEMVRAKTGMPLEHPEKLPANRTLPKGETWDCTMREDDAALIYSPRRANDVAVIVTEAHRNFMLSGHPLPGGHFNDTKSIDFTRDFQPPRGNIGYVSARRVEHLASLGIEPKVLPVDEKGRFFYIGNVHYEFPDTYPSVGHLPVGPAIKVPVIEQEKARVAADAEAKRLSILEARYRVPPPPKPAWMQQAEDAALARTRENMAARQSTTKGEGPGHPFRGNQFVRGQSGGGSAGGGGRPDVAGSGPPGATYVEHPQAAMALIRNGKDVIMPQSALESTFVAMHEDVTRATEAGQTPTVYNLKHVSIAGISYADQPWSNPANHRDLSRAEMPQVPRKNGIKTMFIKNLRKSGVNVKEKEVDAIKLRGIQREVNGANAGRIILAYKRGSLDTDRIPISREGHILDGHHRWAASIAAGRKIGVYKVDLSTDKLIASARKMNKKMGVQARGIEELGPTTKARIETLRLRIANLRRSEQ